MDDRVSISGKGWDFSFRHRILWPTLAHRDSCSVDAGVCFYMGKTVKA
jgi:hypothetical protein